jgi:hypothetical protein
MGQQVHTMEPGPGQMEQPSISWHEQLKVEGVNTTPKVSQVKKGYIKII